MTINEKLLKELIKSVLDDMPNELAVLSANIKEQQSELSLSCVNYNENNKIIKKDNIAAVKHNKIMPSALSTPIKDNYLKNDLIYKGMAQYVNNKNEIIIAVSPAFASQIKHSLFGIPHRQILKELILGLELQKIDYRLVRVCDHVNLLSIANKARNLSGSGSVITIQSTGSILLHLQRPNEYSVIEIFADIALMIPLRFRQIGNHAAQYLTRQCSEPLYFTSNHYTIIPYQQELMRFYQAEQNALIEGEDPYELSFRKNYEDDIANNSQYNI